MNLVIQEHIPLAPHTTLGIGGPARYLIQAESVNTVLDAIEFAHSRQLPVAVIGGGSNLLVSDDGFPGLVLQVTVSGCSFEDDGDASLVRAGAGVDWDGLVAECVEQNLAGVECMSGIPGWVGATPVQNVGAYGQEVAGVIEAVRAFDRDEGREVHLPASACVFGYRTSVFNTTARNRYIVLGVDYRLQRNGRPVLEYPELQRHFGDGGAEPGLSEVREAVRKIRASKAMLLVEDDADCRSAGSFFKNPRVTAEEFSSIEAAAMREGDLRTDETFPGFVLDDGNRKMSAARLIESAGFRKGTERGAVALSGKHALALVNRGGASAADVLEFAVEIQTRVDDRFGVRLMPEPAFLGFPSEVVARLGAVRADG